MAFLFADTIRKSIRFNVIVHSGELSGLEPLTLIEKLNVFWETKIIKILPPLLRAPKELPTSIEKNLWRTFSNV